MVDPIGLRPGFAVERKSQLTEKVEAVAKAAVATKTATEQPQVAQTSARDLARSASTKAPVDHERVAQIKRAIAEGRFPIVPAKIADRLIAAQMEWVRVDEAGE